MVLARSAAANIPGVDFTSITVRGAGFELKTLAATDPEAHEFDALQYELQEGPCYAAVTEGRFVLANDLAVSTTFPRYGPLAAQRGIHAQAGIQLVDDGEQAGLNLYARRPDAFDSSTIQFADLYATHAAVLLGYARQVETLGHAVHSRQDIGMAIGILMERYGIDSDRAFGFLTRISNNRNVKVRELAQQVIDGTFDPAGDTKSLHESDPNGHWSGVERT